VIVSTYLRVRADPCERPSKGATSEYSRTIRALCHPPRATV
jgi:hypothetical protein